MAVEHARPPATQSYLKMSEKASANPSLEPESGSVLRGEVEEARYLIEPSRYEMAYPRSRLGPTRSNATARTQTPPMQVLQKAAKLSQRERSVESEYSLSQASKVWEQVVDDVKTSARRSRQKVLQNVEEWRQASAVITNSEQEWYGYMRWQRSLLLEVLCLGFLCMHVHLTCASAIPCIGICVCVFDLRQPRR